VESPAIQNPATPMFMTQRALVRVQERLADAAHRAARPAGEALVGARGADLEDLAPSPRVG